MKILEFSNTDTNLDLISRPITVGKENNLVNSYIDYRKSIFKSTNNHNLAIFKEIKIGNTFPDIVFVDFNPENYENWNSIRQSLSKNEYRIIYFLLANNGCEQLADVVKLLNLDWKTVATSFEKLYDAKLIVRKDSIWKLKNQKTVTCKNIQAIEAKYYNWDRVLQQSILNKSFASESYILSSVKKDFNPDVLQKFQNFGIGIYLEKDNQFKQISKAENAKLPINYNSIFFNELIGKALYSNR